MMSLNFSVLLIFFSSSSPKYSLTNLRKRTISNLDIWTWSQYNITLFIFTIGNSNNIATNLFNFTSVWFYFEISLIAFEIFRFKFFSSFLPICIKSASVFIPWVSESFYPILIEDVAFVHSDSTVSINSKGALEDSKCWSINFFNVIIKKIFSL